VRRRNLIILGRDGVRLLTQFKCRVGPPPWAECDSESLKRLRAKVRAPILQFLMEFRGS
jgi:hypothetical protein